VADDVELRAVRDLPANIARLAELAGREGFPFVERLVREWESGENRFAAPREVFFFLYRDGALAGFGGLNVDPYAGDEAVGRVRHVYVDPDLRGSGLGARLVRAIVVAAHPGFRRLRLATRQAAPFYESLGFAPTSEDGATHVMDLSRGHA
jgi:N-acetylglutamate synthase-like GNAT family acetyltransferase